MKKLVLIIFILLIVLLIVYSIYFYKIEFQKKELIRGIVIGKTSEPADHYHLRDYFEVEKIVDAGLPTGLAFSPDGRLFYSEITGMIKFVDKEVIKEFAIVPDSQTPAVEKGEAGLHGIAIDPDFENNGYLYVYYLSGGSGKIGRFEDVDGKGRNFEIIFDGVPHWQIHNGGDLEFGRDGKLYLSTGDATDIKQKLKEKNPAQDIKSKAGKVLRINKDGSIPKDNPFSNSYTYAYGFRNIFGFAIDPVSGIIYAGDQGIDCCEEVNLVDKGKNYGWAIEMGIVEEGEYEDPIYAWDAKGRVSPTGMVYYTGGEYGESYRDNLFMTTWRTREIYRFVLRDEKIEKVEAYSVDDYYDLVPITGMHAGEIHPGQKTESGSIKTAEGLLDIVEGEDGYLYFSDVKGIYRLLEKNIFK